MNIKEYINKHGWLFDCEIMEPFEWMEVVIGFINNEGLEDETSFDIRQYNTNELNELFNSFCNENNFNTNTVQYIGVIKISQNYEQLAGD